MLGTSINPRFLTLQAAIQGPAEVVLIVFTAFLDFFIAKVICLDLKFKLYVLVTKKYRIKFFSLNIKKLRILRLKASVWNALRC